IGNRRGEGAALQQLGSTYRDLHRYREAADAFGQALPIHLEIGNRWGEAHTLAGLAETLHHEGRTREAIALCRRSLAILEELSDAQTAQTRARLRLYADAAPRPPRHILRSRAAPMARVVRAPRWNHAPGSRQRSSLSPPNANGPPGSDPTLSK